MGFTTVHAVCALINFVLFAIVIAKFVVPALGRMVDERHAETMRALTDAESAERRAAEALGALETRVGQLDAEVSALLADAAVSARNQAQMIAEGARFECERLKAQAQAEIVRERQAAIEALRQMILEQAFERATMELQQQMNVDRQRELVAGVVQKVGDGSLVLR